MSELIEYIEDSCPDCKKEIFATHDRFYVIPANGVPSDYIGYDFDINDFAPATYSTLELHRLYFTSTGNCYDFPTGVQGCPSTSTGILFSDPTFQAKLDAILVQEGYAAGDVVVTTNGSVWTTWFSPSFDYTNNTNLFWAGDNTDYFNKITPTIVTNETPSLEDLCLPIQEIKEKDTCTNLETYRYIIEDGTGNLVDVTDIIPNFDENKVLFKCVEPLPILEKEICGTIDGSIDNYELIKIYTREPLTGVQNIIHYEDKFGNIVTGEVVEVCCNCNSLCSLPTLLLNRVCFGYAGSFNGDTQFPDDKAISGADIFIEYLEVNNNILINSQTNIGNTGAATFSDMGYGIAYDSVVNLLNNNALINSNDIRFVTAGNILADRGWGIEYNDAKSYRIVISDFITASSATQFWTIVLNPTEQWEGIGNGAVGNNWTLTDFTNNTGTASPFNACNII